VPRPGHLTSTRVMVIAPQEHTVMLVPNRLSGRHGCRIITQRLCLDDVPGTAIGEFSPRGWWAAGELLLTAVSCCWLACHMSWTACGSCTPWMGSPGPDASWAQMVRRPGDWRNWQKDHLLTLRVAGAGKAAPELPISTSRKNNIGKIM